MSKIAELRELIHRPHGGEATHRASVPAKETYEGETIWDRVVEVFRLKGHPETETVYAWSHDTNDPGNPVRHVTVLHVGPITSAIHAVRAASCRSLEALSQPKKTSKAGRPPMPKGDAKTVMLRVRITVAEYKAVGSPAQSKGQTVSQWLRSKVTAEIGA